jgi:hypothetical protein
VFTQSFTRHSDPPSGFGSNLIGAILGGCLEYLSLLGGFSLLWWLGAGLYALSAWALFRQRRA